LRALLSHPVEHASCARLSVPAFRRDPDSVSGNLKIVLQWGEVGHMHDDAPDDAAFRELAEHGDDVLWIRDAPSGRLVYVSPAYERVWGRPRDELAGTPLAWAELIHPDDRERVLAATEGERGTEYVLEYRILRPDGSQRWIRQRGFPVRDPRGTVVRAAAIARDVTDHRSSGVVLDRKEARFRALIEHSAEIITVLDESGTIHYESPAAGRLLGWALEDRLDRSILDFIHPEDLARVEDALARALREATPISVECRVRHRDGSYRRLFATGVNLLDEPAVRGIVVNSRDVTELREGEERLRHAQKLEAVGRLAGGVAHDFNNVLTTITATAQLLLMDLPDDSPWRDDVLEIDRAGARAAALTQQLLTFSRQQVLQPEVLDLNAVVRSAERMLRLTLGEHVALVTRLDERLVRVLADRGQVEQVLMNLAVNARDAMPRGGTVVVETGNEPPDATAAELRVSDTGTGMPEEVRERIFEPFYTTKPRGKGTGLGLATVHGIVKQSGGSIRVDSEPGRGTTFTIRLPPASAGAER
jgi:two-component system cell cycle sensor histidine kinase/response regulator CckA